MTIVQIGFGQLSRFADANDLMYRQCSRTHTAFMATTINLSFQTILGRPRRTYNAPMPWDHTFVTGETQQINLTCLDVNRYATQCLNGITVEHYLGRLLSVSSFCNNRTNLCNRLNDTNLVVCKHDRDNYKIHAMQLSSLPSEYDHRLQPLKRSHPNHLEPTLYKNLGPLYVPSKL